MKTQDEFNRTWIIKNSKDIVSRYEKGVLTLRGLHYQLVAIGMTNTLRHYKRVVSAMIKARWDGVIDFECFSDHDREVIGVTRYKETDVDESIEEAKRQIGLWMKNFNKNKWENQPYYPEVFIEKKALQGVFEKPCKAFNVSLSPCKGYPSLTFLKEAAERFRVAKNYYFKKPVILYFGDYDPSGEDIPRSIEDNLLKFGVKVEVKRIALMHDQVVKWKLPYAPAKVGDSRTASWDGLGQVELDAIDPRKLQKMCTEAIQHFFDDSLYEDLMAKESEEEEIYREELKTYVKTL